MARLAIVSTSQPAQPEAVRHIPMFAGLDDDTYAMIAATSMLVGAARGEVLFHQGDPSVGFYYIEQGQIELGISGQDGTRKVVEVVSEGETFGEAVVFVGRPYPVTALAARACELVLIPSGTIADLIDSNPSVTRKILSNMAVRLHQLINDVESYTLTSATSRVAKYLLDRVPHDGLVGPAIVALGTSKQVVASRLNLTPETFSRSLRRLTEAHAIRVEGRIITVINPVAMATDPRWQS